MGYILPVTNFTAQQYQARLIKEKRSINQVEQPQKIVFYRIDGDEEKPRQYAYKKRKDKKKKQYKQLSEEMTSKLTGKGEQFNARI